MTTTARRWTVWAPAAVSVVGCLVALMAWVFGLAAAVGRNTERVVALERLTVKARAVKSGSRVTFVESELFDHHGELCARATATTVTTDWPDRKQGPDA